MFFPGLGQLYNGEYEKGMITVLAGFPLFGLAVWGVAEFIASAHPRNPYPLTPFGTAAAIIGLLGYGALLVWSVWDAYRAAQSDDTSAAQGSEL
jgi:membrane protein implicated in regulation of membrane protease activity